MSKGIKITIEDNGSISMEGDVDSRDLYSMYVAFTTMLISTYGREESLNIINSAVGDSFKLLNSKLS